MGREVDSIPFYNKDKVLIASFNVYMKTLYWSWRATEEDRAEVYKKLEKKKYKGYTELESTGHKAGTETPYTPAITIDRDCKDLGDVEEEAEETPVEEAPKKRHRRTKAEMEQARAQEAAKVSKKGKKK